jgi:hypothetical protein
MEWRHSDSTLPAPKNSECKNPLEKFWPRFFFIKTASYLLITSKVPKYQRGVLLNSAGAIEGHFEEKTLRAVSSPRQYPGSPGTCNPEETGLPGLPMSRSTTLFFGSGPVGLQTVPWSNERIKISPFFFQHGCHWCREDLVERTIWIVFWVACIS